MFGQRNSSANDTNATPPLEPTAPLAPLDDPTPPPLAPGAPSFSGNDMYDDPLAEATEPPMTPAAPSIPVAYDAPAPKPVTAGPVNKDDLTTDDLLDMKQEALKHLQPLVDNLQQSPDEEFRTIMMMIQATDDRSMLKKALEAAKKIPDDKTRAQAMLDVINEINYFTQAQQGQM